MKKQRDFKCKVVISFILLITLSNIDYSKIFSTEQYCKAYTENPCSSHFSLYLHIYMDSSYNISAVIFKNSLQMRCLIKVYLFFRSLWIICHSQIDLMSQALGR